MCGSIYQLSNLKYLLTALPIFVILVLTSNRGLFMPKIFLPMRQSSFTFFAVLEISVRPMARDSSHATLTVTSEL